MADARTWPGTFYEGANFLLLARVVDLDAQPLTQDDFNKVVGDVVLTIYDITGGANTQVYQKSVSADALAGQAGGPLAGIDVVADTSALYSGYGWPDNTGFNLALLVKNGDFTAVTKGGRLYQAEAALAPKYDSGTIYVVWKLRCQPVIS